MRRVYCRVSHRIISAWFSKLHIYLLYKWKGSCQFWMHLIFAVKQKDTNLIYDYDLFILVHKSLMSVVHNYFLVVLAEDKRATFNTKCLAEGFVGKLMRRGWRFFATVRHSSTVETSTYAIVAIRFVTIAVTKVSNKNWCLLFTYLMTFNSLQRTCWSSAFRWGNGRSWFSLRAIKGCRWDLSISHGTWHRYYLSFWW